MKKSDDKISQRSYESLLALSAATNEWETYDMVFHEMTLSDFEIESGTYASILKECYSTGNGAAALKVLESMQSSSSTVKPGQEHFRLSILALCRNNKTEKATEKRRKLMAMTYSMDRQVGRIFDYVEQSNQNTIIFFLTSTLCSNTHLFSFTTSTLRNNSLNLYPEPMIFLRNPQKNQICFLEKSKK